MKLFRFIVWHVLCEPLVIANDARVAEAPSHIHLHQDHSRSHHSCRIQAVYRPHLGPGGRIHHQARKQG